MISASDPRVAQAILRTDFPAFFSKTFTSLQPGSDFRLGWQHEHMCFQAEEVRHGRATRLIINVPPRSGKSMLMSVAWPMFLLGHDPSIEVLAISHTDSLARDFALKRRAIAEQGWYKDLFPALAMKRTLNMELQTTAGGRILGAGVGGGVLGKGADVLILDDPQRDSSEAERRRFNEHYTNVLYGRLNNKSEGKVVLVMQRLHEDDATGFLLANDDFRHVALPAMATEDQPYALSDDPDDVYNRVAGEVLDPVREPFETLEQIRRSQGAMFFQAQYQQQPIPAGGNAIKREWIHYYGEQPPRFDRIVVSWDTASTLGDTSDYSVGTVWGAVGLDFYLLHIERGRFEAPALRRLIVKVQVDWGANATLVEDTELGRAIVSELREAHTLRPLLIPPQGSKQARLEAQAARFETGQVHLPSDHPLIGEYLKELLAFPNGRNDDQVDSTSQALRYLTGYATRKFPSRRPDRPRPAGRTRRTSTLITAS